MAIDPNALEGEHVTVRDLKIPAEESQLSRVRDFVAEVCEETGFSAREASNTKLAVDEACTNVIKHAYGVEGGHIKIVARIGPGKLEVAIQDEGRKFDFASIKDPDLDQYVETGKKGGLGVFLINRLMDGVEYHSTDIGNELVLTKSSHAALSRVLPGKIPWRGSLRYKFTMRATFGLFVLIAAIWGYIFMRQTNQLETQRTTQWLEKKRLAESVADKSTQLLLTPEAYSVEQTTLTAYVSRTMEGNSDLAYIRIVDLDNNILSSSTIDEIFTAFRPEPGTVLLEDPDNVRWTRVEMAGQTVRDIRYPVTVRNVQGGGTITIGDVYLGVVESAMYTNAGDPRLITTLIIMLVFVVGVLLISGLVSVFVKPIQVLTDGVRAIGQGSMDSKLDVGGPAEIGAIASVFNEISDKFKKAQESVLEKEKLQKEIEVAKQIQQALLPKKHPDISGYDIAPYYQAAKEVGGDYYDFVKVDDDTLGIVVADVSGKGVPGSLVMTMIRTALRMEARGNKNASDVMSKMNDFVTDDMKKGMFVTMFYIILDSKNRIISYASAGHNPMILYRAEGNETYFLNPKGFPVGIALPDEALFRQSISLEKIKLKKDDMLLIYTDGVTEAMNEKRDQYGEERLIELVRTHGHLHPTEFINILEGDIKNFTAGHAQNDDITVVAVKEKLVADDVLFGIRKKLLDLVDIDGLSVKEACRKMNVSPATYYRYKKRLATMGERGLRNKVLRQDVSLKRVSLEQRKEIIDIVARNPAFGAKRITQEFNVGRERSRHITEKMVYDELRRLNLNTRDLRIEYLRRNKLIDDDDVKQSSSREMVESLLSEVSEQPPEGIEDTSLAPDFTDIGDDSLVKGLPVAPEELDEALEADSYAEDIEESADMRVTTRDAGEDVKTLLVEGHLDSVSSSVLEKKLHEVIAAGNTKILVDLSKVVYISSGGWGIFVGEVRRLRESGGDVVLVGMTAEVYDVYELLGFADILRAFAASDDALEYFRKPAEERFTVSAAPKPPAPSVPDADEFADEAYSSEWESLSIEAAVVGEDADIAVISLRGIIDTISAEQLRAAIDKVIVSGIYKVVVDTSQVEYVSSGGWGTFTERLREVRRQGGDIKLFGMDADVHYVFTMLGFNIVLSSFDILADAIGDFSQAAENRPSVHPHQSAPRAARSEASPDIHLEDEPLDDGDDVFDAPQRAVSTPLETLTWRDLDGRLLATLSGSVDASTVEEIDAEVHDRLHTKPKVLVFNMADVSYVSSAGWGIFAKYHERMVVWGGRMAMCAMNQDLHDVFRLLEFHTFIDVYETPDAAIAGRGDVTPSAQPPPVTPTTPDGPPETAGAPQEPASVDDILGADDLTEAVAPSTPSAHADDDEWPDILEEGRQTKFKPIDDTPDDTPDDEPAEPPVTAPSDERFVDYESKPGHVDIEGSVSDDSVGSDKKLRNMGWGAYGERLRKNKKQNPEDEES